VIEEIESFIKTVDKQYGENTLYFLGKVKPLPIECIPTGSLELDLAIGGGERFMGIPVGRITQLWGPKDSGKTTLCNHIIANAQRLGYPTAFFDYEHSYDPIYAQKIGVDLNKLLFGQYTELERGWSIIEALVRKVPKCVIVVDSIVAMTPRAEIEGEFGDTHVGLQPRLLAQAMRRNMGPVRSNKATIIVTNQVRHKIGTMKWERSETQAGGEALRHALGLQIDLWPSSIEKVGDEIIARKIRATISHSKIARPYGKAEYRLEFGVGIDQVSELIRLGVAAGAIRQSGAYYYYGDNESHVAQGKKAMRDWLAANPDAASAIRQKIIETINGGAEDADL